MNCLVNSKAHAAGFKMTSNLIGPESGGVHKTGVKKNTNWISEGITTFRSRRINNDFAKRNAGNTSPIPQMMETGKRISSRGLSPVPLITNIKITTAKLCR
jgi:hypothetical protein